MRGKQLLLILAVALVSLALMAGGGTPAKANPPPGIQDFNLDMVNCVLPSYPPDTISPNPLGPLPMSCAAGEDGSVNGGASLSTAINLPAGDRLGSPYLYNGPGWVLQSDAQIPDGTIVGDVVSVTDFFQDGIVDWIADSTNCGGVPKSCSSPLTFATATPEQYIEEGLTFGPGTGCTKPGGLKDDETYLNSLMPGAAAMTKYVRYRACIDTVYLLGQFRIDVVALNGSPAPLNLVTLSPVWSPAGTHVSLLQLAGAPDSPTTGPVGLDSPESSLSHTNAPYATNPAALGLYARWTTEISAPDQADGAVNFELSTRCKAIGGNFPDADADCQPDAFEQPTTCSDTGWPTTPATTIVDNPDSDGDGLPDGIEVAWGSNPCQSDTDLDGRTDLEEMAGPTQFLTNPIVADTDADTVPDSGLTLDADGDGAPDFPDVDGDDVLDLVSPTPPMPVGWELVNQEADGSSHVRVGYMIVGTDIEPDGGGMDNCPSIFNPAQTNTDLDTATTWGHGDLYGDACDTDDDNDGVVDDAELNFQYDQGAHQCANDPDLPGTATPLNPLNPDTDGDGVLDGVECEVGSNPADAGDSPGARGVAYDPDPDQDGVSNAYETFKHTQGFSGPASEDVDSDGLVGQNDPDSDNDGLSDGCEVYVTGTNPMMPDSDGNGTNDPSEANLTARIATYCGSATDLDGDGVTNDLDNCLFASNAGQANTNPAIGNGRGIPGDDGTVSWNRVNDKRGDACDGDRDNDGLPNSIDPDPFGDITYDDNGNGNACAPMGTDAADDGASWDTNCNGRLDGREVVCVGSFPDMPAGWAYADSDGDGLLNKLEFCKWGSSPNRVDSDGDTLGDCVEAADVDGDILVDFVSDVIRYAKATLLTSPPPWGKDGDFDIDGNSILTFTGDVIQETKFALIGTPGTATGICK